MIAQRIEHQAKSIVAQLTRLLIEERVSAHDGVLICNGSARSSYERALRAHPLLGPARFGRLEDYGSGVVTLDTVARFKGLEREVVVLRRFDGTEPARKRETLYVGISRAKAALYLCGNREACFKLVEDD